MSEEIKKPLFSIADDLEAGYANYMDAGITPVPVKLVSVTVNHKFLKKDDEDATDEEKEALYKSVLNFKFETVGIKGQESSIKVFNHVEYEAKEDANPKYFEYLSKRIKQIYEAFATFPKGMKQCNTYGEFFDEVARMFNENGKDKTPIFTNVGVYLHLVYDKKALKFPAFVNFIEKAIPNVPTNLRLRKDRFVYEIAAPAAGMPGMPGGEGGGMPNSAAENLPF
jgi:hypothetical protein